MTWSEFITAFWMELLAMYAVVQVVVPLAARGVARLLAFLPLPFMLFAGWTAFSAYQQHSNLWPLSLVLSSPIALLYLLLLASALIVVAIVRRKSSARVGRP